MVIKFRRFEHRHPTVPINFTSDNENMKIKDFEFETEKDAWDWFWKEIKDFITKNNVKNPDSDKSLNRFRVDLVHTIWDALNSHYKDYNKCLNCPEEDHESERKWACRCENRNMRVGRERRKRGESGWIMENKLDEKE